MQVDSQKRLRLTIERSSHLLAKLAAHPTGNNVHKFRTQSRRVETILGELLADPSRNQKKVLKQLARLRKKAGKIRDLDVQIATLRNLKIPQAARQKSELLRVLAEDLAKRQDDIVRLCKKTGTDEVRKRMKRVLTEIQVPSSAKLLQMARRKIMDLDVSAGPPSEKTLHSYRVIGKQARYIAELAGESPEVLQFIENLKQLQDLLGDWHDWLQLSMSAEEHLGGSAKSPLSAALQNVARAKYRQASDGLLEVRSALIQKSEPPPRKNVQSSNPAKAAVA